MNFLTDIVEKRKNLISQHGFTQGSSIPEKRETPLVPFIRQPFLICEIKRRSPSKGDIAPGLDAIGQADLYARKGIQSVSVLTEPQYFCGSLDDLMLVKKAFPGLSVLRKDFLLSVEDIDVSFRAGADAVLLIASILSESELSALYNRAISLGMTPLVEVHGSADVDKARKVKPVLTGINARDLDTFTIDMTFPLSARREIDWETTLIFESGMKTEEDAALALSSGFSGVLVGESVVRRPDLIGELMRPFSSRLRDFWGRLYAEHNKPFAKICGITNTGDAEIAVRSGADILGFIFAPSARRADYEVVRQCKNLDVLKAGVVVTDGTAGSFDQKVKQLFDDGFLDVIQFHGFEDPAACYSLAFPYYKAMRIKDERDADRIGEYRCPRILIDAYSEKSAGGTGENIPENLIEHASKKKPLWLAGGLDPTNIRHIIDRFKPELVDASSRLESSPGKKDPDLVARFLKEIKR